MSGFKYVRVLNIHKFSLTWQGSENASGSKYGRPLIIPGLWVSKVSVYASVAQGSEIQGYGRVLK